MTGREFERLLAIAERKNKYDQTNAWANGSPTYLAELKKEIVEVEEEIALGRKPHLEEELGDVLWDYVNLLMCLDDEGQISADRVLNRAIEKFDERITGIENGEAWQDIKARQKARMLERISASADSTPVIE